MNEEQIAQEILKITTTGIKNGDQKDYEMTYNNETYMCYRQGSKWRIFDLEFGSIKQIKTSIVLGEFNEVEDQPKIDPEHGDVFDCIDPNALLIHILKYGYKDIVNDIEKTVIANARTKFRDGVEVIDYDWAANEIDQYRKRQQIRLNVNLV